MDNPDRGPAVFAFMATAKAMLWILAGLAIVSLAVTLGSITESRKQTLEAIDAISKRIERLDTRADMSEKDRAELRETQGALREMLKRAEVKK